MTRASAPSLLSVSFYQQRPGVHPAGRRIPAGLEVIELVTHGGGQVRHEDTWIDVEPGMLLWHVAGDWTIERSVFDDPYKCLAVQVRVDHDAERPVPHVSWWRDLDEVRRFTQEVLGCFVDDRFDRGVLLRYILGRLSFQARRHHHAFAAADSPAGLLRVLDLIERDYAEPLRLNDLADAAHWSTAHLHDVFRQHLDTTPHQALLRRRVQAAREQLIGTRRLIKEIARDCGFTTVAGFCRTFKQTTGQTPAEYRRRHAHLRPLPDSA